MSPSEDHPESPHLRRRPGCGSLSQQDCHSTETATKFPEQMPGWTPFDLSPYSPATYFKARDANGITFRKLHTYQEKFYDRLYKHQNDYHVPYQPRAISERNKKERQFEFKLRVADAVVKDLVNRSQRETVIGLMASVDFTDGALNAYSIEEVAIGLASLILQRDERPMDWSHLSDECRDEERGEWMEVKEKKSERLTEQLEQYELSKKGLSNIKRSLRDQFEWL